MKKRVKACLQCGAVLPNNRLEGNCPNCLLRLVLPEPAKEHVHENGDTDFDIGRVRYIGDYELLKEIARGGMGVVYKARQSSLKRMVAVKLVPLGSFATETCRKRFHQEAEAVARLHHPNIVSIYETGEHEGQPYFSMELIEGSNLAKITREKPVQPRQAAEWLQTIAEAIHCAHERGVLHRDLKPSNIIIDEAGQPHITDFGLARRLEVDSDLTLSGQVIGTPSFMSPEQATGQKTGVGVGTDIYSLGALLFHLLTGRPPFLADSVEATLRQVIAQPPVSPRLLNPLIPRDLETICLKCLEKEPERRYPSAEALAKDLGCWLEGKIISARPASKPEKLWRWCQRNPALAVTGGLAFLAVVLGFAGIFAEWQKSERHRKIADENRQTAEVNLYVADMNRAQKALDETGSVAARALLNRHTSQTNLHGFEWRYLWNRCQGDYDYFLATSNAQSLLRLAFSPDGKTLAVLESNGKLWFWDLERRQARVRMTNVVGMACYTGTSSNLVLATGGARTNLVIYNFDADKILDVLATQGMPVSLLEDGRALAVSTRTEFRLLDIATGEPLGGMALPAAASWGAAGFYAFTFSDDGKLVFTLDNALEETNQARLSVREFPSLQVLASHTEDQVDSPTMGIVDQQYTLRLFPDRSAVWINHDGYFRRWRWWESGAKPEHVPAHRGVVFRFRLAPTGRWFATAGADQSVRIWDIDTFKELAVLRGHNKEVTSIDISPDGKWLGSVSDDGRIGLWKVNLKAGGNLASLPVARGLANQLRFSPDGKFVATGLDGNGIVVTETSSGAERGLLSWGMYPVGLVESNKTVIGLTGSGSLAGCLDREFTLPNEDYLWSYDLSPDGALLAVSHDSQPRLVSILNARSREVITNWLSGDRSTGLKFMADTNTLVIANANGMVQFYRYRQGQFSFAGKTKAVNSWLGAIGSAPDGRMVAVGARSEITLLDSTTMTVIDRLYGHSDYIYGLSFSPDGKTLASCGKDGTIKLWSLAARQELCTIPFFERHQFGVEPGVQRVAFAPDGNSLWAISRSGMLKVWRTAAVNEIHSR